MSKRYYVLGMLLFCSLLFVFSGASLADPGHTPQDKAKTDAQAPQKVSPAKPGVKPPVLHEEDGCKGCCGCCCCCGERSRGCKAAHKKASRLHLGSQHEKNIKIEKCVGETGAPECREVKIIREHPPGPKHKIMHCTSKAEGMTIMAECLEACKDDCGADCTHKIAEARNHACRSECMESCGGGHGSSGNMWVAKANCGSGRSCDNVWISKGRMNDGMGDCPPAESCFYGPDCLLMCAASLGLTDDQRGKLEDQRLATKKKMIDLKAALQKEQLEMQELMNADDLNASAIKRQLDAVASARTDVKFEMISAMIDAKKVLTKEQRELLKEKRQMSMFGGGCCEGHAGMGMHILESCRPQIIGGHKTIDVLVDGDEEGECIKVIEIEE